MDDITVDLGEIPLEHAKAVQLALTHSLAGGTFWNGKTYTAAASVKAMLDYKIALAESFSNPHAFVEDIRSRVRRDG